MITASTSRSGTVPVLGLAVAAATLPLLAAAALPTASATPAERETPAVSTEAHTHDAPSPEVHEHVVEELAAPRTNVQTKRKGRQTVTAPRSVVKGTRYTETATVPVKKGFKRTVKVQVRKNGAWRTVKTLRASKKGRVTVVHKASTTGTVTHRFVAPKVSKTRKRASHATYVSPSVKVKITKPTGTRAPAPGQNPNIQPAPPAPQPEAAPTRTPTPSPAPSPTKAPTGDPTATPAPTTAPSTPTSAPAPTSPAPSSSTTPLPADPAGRWDVAEYLAPTNLLGSPTDWAPLVETRPIGWSTCQPITWAYDPTGAYADSLADLKASFARLSGVSGLKFKYVSGDAAATADIKLGWRSADEFTGRAIGVAYTRYRGDGAKWRIVGADIYFNHDYPLDPGLEPSSSSLYSVGQLFQHEIMHAVGLSHAPANTQVMYPSISRTAPRLGAGDHAGLRHVGSVHPC